MTLDPEILELVRTTGCSIREAEARLAAGPGDKPPQWKPGQPVPKGWKVVFGRLVKPKTAKFLSAATPEVQQHAKEMVAKHGTHGALLRAHMAMNDSNYDKESHSVHDNVTKDELNSKPPVRGWVRPGGSPYRATKVHPFEAHGGYTPKIQKDASAISKRHNYDGKALGALLTEVLRAGGKRGLAHKAADHLAEFSW